MNTAQFNQLEMLEYRAASALVAFEDRAKALLEKSEVRETLNFVAAVILAVTLMMVARYAFGTDGAEFQQGATTLEGWAKGNPGKSCAIAGLLFGSVRAMFVKDYGAFVVPSGIGILTGVIVSIIDASYTATI
ncbi:MULTISPECIES: hypothetical protein [Burkholderia]|uniref:Conjugal transfer protein TraA n=1 Tax=Burkholderia anthinoferrum TaxID=3090833 RepID=A0ABU5WY11_9BURK|nr:MULTISPECIES: hypothetical protein [Burkholderia]MEB2506732.1 hypothetical protein [Burkholderia anthinoferrum]MEB2535805.1 hypothetical protein [Burkholderia anthinoferrum]MEB2564698.1 hypothetical protein [Burkholderia anthinoferrum]MEB2583137.1 hypothetical protein [Burkholderia anthinoferrum]NTX19617.1 hypothetical protein [Burkholderia cepacia]HDR9258845.1 hypothetical protein [Burkholderia vietnamiensis]